MLHHFGKIKNPFISYDASLLPLLKLYSTNLNQFLLIMLIESLKILNSCEQV